MGWEIDNRDYAKEHGINASPFRDRYTVYKHVYSAAAQLGGIPVVIGMRSIWFGAFLAAVILLTVRSQEFRFMWDVAPWFQTLIGYVLLVQIPISIVVAIWPLPWLWFVGLLVAGVAGVSYNKECSAFIREFNVPE
jgi:hypothetical protein